jgi:hypothetical protein
MRSLIIALLLVTLFLSGELLNDLTHPQEQVHLVKSVALTNSPFCAEAAHQRRPLQFKDRSKNSAHSLQTWRAQVKKDP